ncbi:MAG: CRTAC1 family protein, partial [Planctomycetes bacterium]|nr:CRTAC1 family protein [Planctomycetota bacterium]
LDGDGDLDLWVDCYLRWTPATERRCDAPRGGRDYCSPRAYNAPAPDHLFRNDGGGKFTDVSEAAGLRKVYGNALGVVTGDFDGDGRADVFVANDGVENQLWLQTSPGRFDDQSLVWGCAMDRDGTAKAGMGTCAVDIDDDGDLDLYVVNLVSEGDSVYRNEGRHFLDRTATAGLVGASKPFTRFGVGLADFDLDGRLDIYVAHGGVTRTMDPQSHDPYAAPNQVLRGLADLKFAEVRPVGGTAAPAIATSRGAAFGDIDGDGDVDVLVANRDGRPHLMVNVAPRAGNWAMLRVLTAHHGDALGATMTCRAGGRRITRDVRAAYSYCASNDPRIHLGLGAAAVLEDVRVRWTDGTVEAFGDLPAGRVHTVVRGSGRVSEWPTR